MAESNAFFILNLAFLINWDQGTTNAEIESELYRVVWQVKESVAYDRVQGGSFENLEQAQSNNDEVVMLLFVKDIIESIYRLNASKDFDPYIVVGYDDIKTIRNEDTGEFEVVIYWRLLQDIQRTGKLTVRL